MSNPLASIITPAYNAAAFIGDTIRSVLNQSYSHWEMLIIDDGSTDSTVAVVMEFGDTRLRLTQIPHSGIPAVPRNIGLRQAQGEFVAFLDADDTWSPGKLQMVVDAFTSHPGVGIVCHNLHIVREAAVIDTLSHGPAEPEMFKKLLFEGNRLGTSATTARKEVLDRVGSFDERRDFACVEDYDLWLRVALAGVEFYFLPEVLGRYRLHDINASKLLSLERNYANLRSVLTENFRRLPSPSLRERLQHRRSVAHTHYCCALDYLKRHSFYDASVQALKATAVYPPVIIEELLSRVMG